MQNEYQLCQIQGHQGYKFLQCFRPLKIVTHICVNEACKEISRFLCNQCIQENMHGQCRRYRIEIQKFAQHFKDQRLPQIELCLQSQNGYLAKLKYLTKIYENYFSDLGWLNDYCTEKVKLILEDLIKDYKNEIVQVQLLNGIYQQFSLIGVQSLDGEQLNILLDNQCKFINKEIEYYNELNLYLSSFERYDYVEEIKSKLRKIQKELRRINDFLDHQQYSSNGDKFIFENQQYNSNSFFSKNERYFAMYSCNKKSYACNQLIIRKQKTLDVNRQLNLQEPYTYSNIILDPQFNYCIIQPQYKLYANFYTLRNSKQIKLIRKFQIKGQVRELHVSNNNIILVMCDKLFIKVLNMKNELINEIKLEVYEKLSLEYRERQLLNKILFCYGSERRIFAIIADSEVIIYSETQKQPLLSLQIRTQQKFMKFLNNDSQLLILDLQFREFWQINCCNFNITQANNIESIQIDINELNFTKFVDYGVIQILDINDNLWYSFKTSKFNKEIHIKLTKHLIIIPWQESYYGIQVIKRRSITNYERLEYDY